jgi:hypothetical protein
VICNALGSMHMGTLVGTSVGLVEHFPMFTTTT